MTDVSTYSLSFFAPIWSTWGRRLLLLLCVVATAGVAAATTIGASSDGAPSTFAESARLVQSAVSIPLPFLGVLLATDVRAVALDPGSTSEQRRRLLWARLTSSAIAAVGVAVIGVVAVSLATAASGGAWTAVPQIVLASLVVQLVTQFIGFAFGLLIRPAWLAMLVDACVPVGLWAAAGLGGLVTAQQWLFPYDSVNDLISVRATAIDWAQEAVVVAVWVAGLTALAWARLGSRRRR